MAGLVSRLYRGEINVDFVGKQKLWYGLSAVLLIISIAGLVINGLKLGVEFKGGSVFSFKAPTASIEQVRETFGDAGVHPIVQQTNSGWRVTTESLPAEQVTELQKTVAGDFGLSQNDVTLQVIGATWGGQVADKAVIGLIVFMLAIILYLTMAFEWKMALAAIVALLHDLVITAGVYAWSQFEVTPATLLGFLTILGYSLYDAVVVFDMIKEVTAKLGTTSKVTYTQAANDALNHTLIRSLNTTLVAILPVAAILFIGTTLFGAGTLKDLSLALFVGMIVGTYSSLCVATPLLVTLKEREPRYQAIARRLAATGAGAGAKAARQPVPAGAATASGGEKRKKK
ncbi:protein translocase subunit SecF [Planomonospora parontospora subsp. parontospora]|uniref:Protein-export membrane protein SecF n=2 Tax=Planomonospora parontospora TaxID=58119 RepID=A0AA37BMH6_9ACTN|nr:protein translocase subunit SecF [Planomonospora parontospora]GGK91521.1 protein translocase subunit SecF [Planomonospora parontospora]GII11178.1 protein translocase subunit SecF [Planomonospora parontospora subsp. parontospora]